MFTLTTTYVVASVVDLWGAFDVQRQDAYGDDDNASNSRTGDLLQGVAFSVSVRTLPAQSPLCHEHTNVSFRLYWEIQSSCGTLYDFVVEWQCIDGTGRRTLVIWGWSKPIKYVSGFLLLSTTGELTKAGTTIMSHTQVSPGPQCSGCWKLCWLWDCHSRRHPHLWRPAFGRQALSLSSLGES